MFSLVKRWLKRWQIFKVAFARVARMGFSLGIAQMIRNRFEEIESNEFLTIEKIEKSIYLAPVDQAPVEMDSKIEIDSACKICGSENFYLPTKSNRWECFGCNPPRSDRHVAQTKQARKRDETARNEEQHPGWAVVDPAQCWGPYVLRSKIPICKCGSEYFEESGTVCEVKKFCVCCREEIFI